jgi:hypothetical protein
LWDKAGKKNAMYAAKDEYGLSQLGYHFMAGVLEHLPALLALTCPSYNSYRRLQPHFWSSAYTAWGPDNREAAIRVPSEIQTDPPGTTNAELKSSDSSSNYCRQVACWPPVSTASNGCAWAATQIDPATADAERRARHQAFSTNLKSTG